MKILDMNIGDTLVFGEYTRQRGVPVYRQPTSTEIRWSKASDDNCFVARSSVESVPFDETEYHSSNRSRRSHGNNFFPHSNMLQFLNARGDRFFKPAHPNDEPPSILYGFLSWFQDWEIELMEKQKLKTIVPTGSKKEFGSKPYEFDCLVSIPSIADVIPENRWYSEEWGVERSNLTMPECLHSGPVMTRTAVTGSACELWVARGDWEYADDVYANRSMGIVPVIRLRGDTEVVRSGVTYYVDANKYDANPDVDDFASVLTAF